MRLAFDIISGINLGNDYALGWESRVTSPYCIVCGNISSDIDDVYKTLKKLSDCYLGVFYIGGTSELDDMYKITLRHEQLGRICKNLSNVVYLYKHVVVVDNVAIVAAVGWHSLNSPSNLMEEILSDKHRQQDYDYLKTTIERLQLHMEIKHIVVVTSCVPDNKLYFGCVPEYVDEHIPLTVAIQYDTERKITHWIYGGNTSKGVLELDNITYVNNSYDGREMYYAHRIQI